VSLLSCLTWCGLLLTLLYETAASDYDKLRHNKVMTQSCPLDPLMLDGCLTGCNPLYLDEHN
jgi:hypothetical protein